LPYADVLNMIVRFNHTSKLSINTFQFGGGFDCSSTVLQPFDDLRAAA